MAGLSIVAKKNKQKIEILPEAEKLYAEYEQDRSRFIDEAKQCAALTIPSLMPDNKTEFTELERPYTNLGTKGVKNLAGKLMMALFPPNVPFFSFNLTQETIDGVQGDQDAIDEFKDLLLGTEQLVKKEMLNKNRDVLEEAVQHILVCGNVLLQYTGEKLKLYTLDEYCVLRDAEGEVVDIVIKETFLLRALPDELRAKIVEIIVSEGNDPTKDDIEVEIYTHSKRKDGRFYLYQQYKSFMLGEKPIIYEPEENIFLPLRYTHVSKESYGHSHVSHIIDDLSTLNNYCKALRRYAAAAAKLIYLVDPTGLTDVDEVSNAEGGRAVNGREKDISLLKLDKHADFSIILSRSQSLEESLSNDFLLHKVRNAERVTAFEVRMKAAELQQALGGFYSVIAKDLQAKLVNIVYQSLKREKKVPELYLDKSVTLDIDSGIDGLGRNEELQKIDVFLGSLQQNLGPDILATINKSELIRRYAHALNLDIKGLLKSEEEVQQEQAQGMQNHVMAQAMPDIAKQAAKVQLEAAQQQ